MQGQPSFVASTANPTQGPSGALSVVFLPYYPEVIIIVMMAIIKRISGIAGSG
jgi:hypothetical protein